MTDSPSVPEPPNDAGYCVCHAAPLARECPHLSHSGVDQTPLADPDKVWKCDECGQLTQMEDDNGITTSRPLSSMPHEIPSLSSAPTGLTRERLDEILERVLLEGDLYVTAPRETADAVANFMKKLRDAILESSSAPTPEMED
jgi:hypothetical protein